MGIETSDDAAIYKINDETAMIQTVDFFTPVVDDPYTFGQIAAANALSDVYAMGGDPKVALNIVCFPNCLDVEILGEILRGGADKVKETGAVLVGGHSVQDDEPKYGLCVSGFVHPDKVYKNHGAAAGDVLILTKKVGSGVINTAVKGGMASAEAEAAAVAVMSRLNKTAKRVSEKYTVHACTDITGFGVIGHCCEMAEASGVSLELYTRSINYIEGAVEYASMGLVPAGAYSNMGHRQDQVEKGGIEDVYEDLLYDPQTSGGLLFAVPEGEAEAFLGELKEAEPDGGACIAGRALPKGEKLIYLK